MKLRTDLFLFSLFLLMLSSMAVLKALAQSTPIPDTIFQEQFNVTGPDQQQMGKAGQGVDVSFTISQKSTVYLNLTTNLASPTLNVYVLSSADYNLYKTTGSLGHAIPIKDLSKLNTVSYKANGVLPNGTYGVIVQWAQSKLYDTQPSVNLEVDAAKYIPPTPTPTTKP
jgi:hypothetical protein